MTRAKKNRWLTGKELSTVLSTGWWAYAVAKEFIPILFVEHMAIPSLLEGLAILLDNEEPIALEDAKYLYRTDGVESSPTEIVIYSTRLVEQQLPKTAGGGTTKRPSPERPVGRLRRIAEEAPPNDYTGLGYAQIMRRRAADAETQREKWQQAQQQAEERLAEKQRLLEEQLTAAFVGKTFDVAGIEFDRESVTLRLKDGKEISFVAQLIDYEVVSMRVNVDGSDFDLMESEV
ncbi:MAG: hypothetical protein Q7R83_02115 [bacterium]|nr:hypothetical protein [bacterium]